MLAPTDGGLEKLLKPVTTSPESVTLEVWEARVPLDKDADAEALWQQVDEQCLDAELRRRLLANGLRAGVLGGALPDELAAMLGLQGEMPKDDGARVITPDLATPKATRRVVQVNRREQRTIQASDLRPQADVLLSDGGSVRGESFKQVEGRYQLSAESRPGQRVAVRLVPELHHGELRNRYSGSDQGILLMTPSREREAFDNLTVSVELAAGEALVVGCLPQAHATLGGVLHRDAASGRRERKFILVRVLEAPPSEILAER
jgi:hypothetical protein